ncbi:helix-turn-helix domain-containing protein [Agriterribacter humi]|jgi:transcriptional regulator with XRE-family HTH domain|uniref:helix-turn-helix domain-containing protein n=1 Tax=Agriterribacter humi TaxID=1104781 RepID=UPI001264A362|nr:helix-turn-helix transcriptional regulator [Agriterribacter humi]
MARYRNKRDTKRIGEQIKLLRKKRGWNIEDISAMTGFARSTITSIENGAETDTTHLIEIAKAIGVHPTELFNIPIDLKPRYKLSGKRKEQLKLTHKINVLAGEGYFTSPKFVNQVKLVLHENFNIKANSVSISGVLLRLVKENVLKFSKSGRKNLYVARNKK